MRIMLVGADCEENLGMCMVSASAAAHGHKVQVLPFDDVSQTAAVTRCIVERNPGCVALAMQFQHRGVEFLNLASRLRAAGYQGHITCGGQFPSMAWQQVLEGRFGVDSVVIHEADATFGELLDAIECCAPLLDVPGIAIRDAAGRAVRSPYRPLIESLDTLPFANRYRDHSRHFGVPFVPIWGSRGCWGQCTYCSISTCYRDARAHGGGRTLRFRSPENLATEMAALWRAAGGAAIFCFHDETLLMPRPEDSLERVAALRRCLDDRGVGKAALVGKCRPESLTPELAAGLRDLGVIRLYVGIENASQRCSDHLQRRTTVESLRGALDACLSADIFPCYNLLLFEPGATLQDIEENVAFMRRYASIPVNFCRAEPYHGTPLFEQLRSGEGLTGSFLGWDYRVADDRTELLFRICSAVFRERNFEARGVTNRSMGLGYAARVLEFFHEKGSGESARLMRKASELTRAMTLDKCDLLEEIIALVREADLADRDRIERETALLGLRIASANRAWHASLDALIGEMNAFAVRQGARVLPRPPKRVLAQAAQAIAVVGSLSMAAAACGGKTETGTEQVSDGGKDASDGGTDQDGPGPYDALPYDTGTDMPSYDPLPPDTGTYDPLPPDTGTDSGPYDALPYDSGSDDVANPTDANLTPDRDWRRAQAPGTLERWRDTSPRRSMRSTDLPLYQPPVIALSAVREGDGVRVSIQGNPGPIGTRWQADGEIVGDGTTVQWTPSSGDDQIRVAVRTRGGIAIASLRLSDIEV
jgi:anaerobic magnesium-protoporphyrin IX monomethyl ester cyclase